MSRAERPGLKCIGHVHWVDRCDLRMLADKHVEHGLTVIDPGVPMGGRKSEVEYSPSPASKIENMRRVGATYMAEQ